MDLSIVIVYLCLYFQVQMHMPPRKRRGRKRKIDKLLEAAQAMAAQKMAVASRWSPSHLEPGRGIYFQRHVVANCAWNQMVLAD